MFRATWIKPVPVSLTPNDRRRAAAATILFVTSPCVFDHNGTASFKTRSRIRGWSPPSVNTWTLRPSKSWRSISSPPGKKGVRRGPQLTRKSTSLSGPAWPRATEPNTRTLLAPCRSAIRRISGRFLLRISSIPILQLSHNQPRFALTSFTPERTEADGKAGCAWPRWRAGNAADIDRFLLAGGLDKRVMLVYS